MEYLFWGIFFVFIIGMVLLLIGVYFLQKTFYRNQKKFLSSHHDLQDLHSDTGWKVEREWLHQQAIETITIESFDHLKLTGYLIESPTVTNTVVIIAHGYTSKGLDMSSFARFYHDEQHVHVLLPDARAHGMSEGKWIGFGWHERRDVQQWIQWLIQRYGEEYRIVLHGVSMGAATVLNTAGEDIPPQVKGVIADCSYTSVYDEMKVQLNHMYKCPPFPILTVTSGLLKRLAGYSFKEASPLSQVKKIKIPVVFIHGEADAFVPTSMVHQLADACLTTKEKLIIPNAGHATSFFVQPRCVKDTINHLFMTI